ncbi:MAG: hypothetical protein HKP17_05935 [Ignavibacteriaceae bacterium]|nr:hypothetical protein [Ignavibacteria bacterium]MBT8392892.1 hypothetical protein [Ignavibacteria bacterium]NNJ52691.1 hypothetical protein [Ignavibacteriaceae bacterium]
MIVLAIIIVGIAIAISIQLFRSNAIESKRDIVINECTNIATIAISYYKKPTDMGGGGKSFSGWQIPTQMVSTINGSYFAQVTPQQITITGVGTEVVTGNDSIKVQTVVTANDYYSVIIN